MTNLTFQVGDQVRSKKGATIRTIAEMSLCGEFLKYEGRNEWQSVEKFVLVEPLAPPPPPPPPPPPHPPPQKHSIRR